MAYKDTEKNKEYQARYYQEHKEEMRERKNAAQREYAKRTGYAAQAEYNKKKGHSVCFRLFKPQDNDILEKLDSVASKAGYIKDLIRKDINKE